MPKRTRSSVKTAQKIDVQLPSPAQIAELVEAAGLPKNAIKPLHECVVYMTEAMREMANSDASPDARKQRLKQMDSAIWAMKRLADLVAEPSAAPFLSKQLSIELGSSLSTEAFEQLNLPVTGRLAIHTPYTRAAQARSGPYRALDAEAAQLRAVHARRLGASVLEKVLRRVIGRGEAYLALERLNKGGRPPNIYRRYAISRLALIYPYLCGTDPKPTLTGHFMRFCQLVMEALGLPTDGLEDAVRRELEKRAKKQSA